MIYTIAHTTATRDKHTGHTHTPAHTHMFLFDDSHISVRDTGQTHSTQTYTHTHTHTNLCFLHDSHVSVRDTGSTHKRTHTHTHIHTHTHTHTHTCTCFWLTRVTSVFETQDQHTVHKPHAHTHTRKHAPVFS